MSSLKSAYRGNHRVGDEVRFNVEKVITKSTYDIIPETAVHVDANQLYRPKNKLPQKSPQKAGKSRKATPKTMPKYKKKEKEIKPTKPEDEEPKEEANASAEVTPT